MVHRALVIAMIVLATAATIMSTTAAVKMRADNCESEQA
jgi:hypothetical protein